MPRARFKHISPELRQRIIVAWEAAKIKQYADAPRVTYKKIGEQFEVDEQTVRYWVDTNYRKRRRNDKLHSPRSSDGPKGRKSLTVAQMYEARRRYLAGETMVQLARAYGKALSTMRRALRGEVFKNHTDVPPIDTGLRHERRKMTASIVIAARRAVMAGGEIRSIARKLKFDANTVRSAVRGDSWAHITDPPPIPAKWRRVPGRFEGAGDNIRFVPFPS